MLTLFFFFFFFTEQNTALHWAVMTGGKSLVGRLLNHGADPFRVDRRGYGCLHIAAQYGHSLLALFFLNKGISVDSFGLWEFFLSFFLLLRFSASLLLFLTLSFSR